MKTAPTIKKRLKLLQLSASHQHVRKYLTHSKRLQALLDSYKTRQASFEFRRNALDNQKKLNYQLEYDRIRGILSQSTIPHTTKTRLEEREKKLRELGAVARNSINYNHIILLYKDNVSGKL